MGRADELLGSIVVSRAGRDEGEHYLVIGTLGEGMVLLADGDRRPVDRPKKKNIKHVRVVEVDPALKEKLTSGGQVTDAEVRAALLRSLSKIS
ncbi:MAG: KOW domain-containing RNA-binding protein [Armatimonadota bacterium]|nr:KOW domain-containing RNA-binding protein [Armatimonadota bacterium]MDR5702375.1 KOW domain-containing RNA-binding protein [Armatimonadota bacterium]MDR7435468.1 KOW domain-containing RNA-binding protein [Armatimonadota bacterium]